MGWGWFTGTLATATPFQPELDWGQPPLDLRARPHRSEFPTPHSSGSPLGDHREMVTSLGDPRGLCRMWSCRSARGTLRCLHGRGLSLLRWWQLHGAVLRQLGPIDPPTVARLHRIPIALGRAVRKHALVCSGPRELSEREPGGRASRHPQPLKFQGVVTGGNLNSPLPCPDSISWPQ